MALDSGPSGVGKAVTPSDATTIGGCRALFVGTGGNLTLDFADGTNNVVFKNVASGSVLPCAPLRVKAATTALDIVALY